MLQSIYYMTYTKNVITKKSQNISDWYNAVVLQAKLADYGPSKGTMIFMPYGYAIWELVQKAMDARIKERGVENAYFPLFIPESFLKKEKEHVEGFAPELAVVTIGGGKELEEKLIIRPTSETIMYDAYAKWIKSWRDLPVLINQWNNVVRWEKRTYLFLRTTEFLWQEGHTAHATQSEDYETVLWAMTMYSDIYKDYFALAGYVGKKSQSEKFAGADTTLTYESLMPDGKALQSCTSHDLGQNFAKAFDIKFQDKDGELKYVWQTSWGFSTRSIGGLILAHGDDNGLLLPPRLAPTQVIIIPVNTSEKILAACSEIKNNLEKAGVRAKVDSRGDETLGYRINKWELKGAPMRIEVGEKEIAAKQITLVRRDTSEKVQVAETALTTEVGKILEDIQENLYKKSLEHLHKNTFDATSYDEFKKIMETSRGFIKAFWCENSTCETTIKEETKATTRCLPLDSAEEKGVCVHCGLPATHKWLFAQAY